MMVENVMNRLPSFYAKRIPLTLSLVVVLFALVMSLYGCSAVKRRTLGATRSVAMKFKTEDRGLKRTIALMPIESTAQFASADETQQFKQQLVTRLSEQCKALVLLQPDDGDFPARILSPPRLDSGALDNLALAAIAREAGIYGVAFIRITGVFTDERFAGLLWWRKPKTVLQVQLVADLYGAQTGAKLLSESYTQEIEIDPDVAQVVDTQRQLVLATVTEALMQIAIALEADLCDGIMMRPWQGFVTRIDSNRVYISSGSNAGLKVGDKFEVFPQGTIITGLGEERFWLPGPKVAEIKLVTVEPQHAEAIVPSESQIPLNSTIQTR
jgi:hypothetical protein